MKNKGFSLVELIVVIAIMAILVGVAVPVYTSYIEKAQKSKDEQLVDEIKHAIEIAAVGESWYTQLPEGGAVGTIVLKNGANAVVTGDLIADALEATFGGDYASKLQLSYDGWTGTLNADMSNLLMSSSYVPEGSSASKAVTDLLGTVQSVTTLFADVVGDSGVDVDSEYFENLYGLQAGETPTKQQTANGMVVYIAEQQAAMMETDPTSFVVGWMTQDFEKCAPNGDPFAQKAAEYAWVQAMVSRTGCEALKTSFAAYNTTFQGASPYTAIWQAHKNGSGDTPACSTCAAAFDAMTEDAYAADAASYSAILSQVVQSKDMVIQNGNSETMYTDSPLVQYVSSYVSVAELLSGAQATAQNGDVILIVYLDKKGAISVDAFPMDY